MRRGLIRLKTDRYSREANSDLTTQVIGLDRRVLDWVVGLDTEINELVEGSNLYAPKFEMSDVVLPSDQKEAIMKAVTSFQQFKAFRDKNPRSEEASVGTFLAHGLVLLFSGPSGTGKTLTANAVAAYLDKKVLLVNFNLMAQSAKESSPLQTLFREATMNDAVIFFDECESLFAKRGTGGSTEMTELLTEIERFSGIVFLATNSLYLFDCPAANKCLSVHYYDSCSPLYEKSTIVSD